MAELIQKNEFNWLCTFLHVLIEKFFIEHFPPLASPIFVTLLHCDMSQCNKTMNC